MLAFAHVFRRRTPLPRLPILRSLLLAAPLLAAPAFAGEASSYQLTIEAPKAKVGTPGQVSVVVKAGKGYHVNERYPTSLTITPPPGVELPKPKLTAKDGARIDAAQARFDVAYTATNAGAKVFKGVLKFAVCTDTTCDPHNEKISFTVDAK